MREAYYNGTIFTGSGTVPGHAVLVKDGMIEGLVKETGIPAERSI
jgi:hypothetical protein